MIRVFVVEDEPPALRKVKRLLEAEPDLVLCGSAGSCAEAISEIRRTLPDLLLLDIHLPDTTGIELCKKILKGHPGTKIIVFSSDAARPLVDEALEAGVCGYVSKSSSVEELLAAREHWRREPSSSPGMPSQWCLLSGPEIELSVTVDRGAIVVYVMDANTEIFFDDVAALTAWLDADEALFLERPSMAAELFDDLLKGRIHEWGRQGLRPG